MHTCRVLLTYAQSLDGRIATASGESRYISQSGSLLLSQELRRDSDAILVGIGTVLRDDPALTCRIDPDRTPARIVLDSSLRIPPESQLVRTAKEIPTAVYCGRKAAESRAATGLRDFGVDVRPVTEDPGGRPELQQVMRDLSARNIGSVMVEGGASILTAFVSAGLWDRILLVTAPLFLGRGIEVLDDIGVTSLKEAIRPRVREIRIIGNEVVWDLEQAGERE